jgi:hypothetical protein
MGADTFGTTAEGKTAHEAFYNAQSHASWEHGHGGYTGTIAEKDSFVMIPEAPSEPRAASAYARQLIDDTDARIDDKWGPAGCIKLDDNKWLFFGWASS